MNADRLRKTVNVKAAKYHNNSIFSHPSLYIIINTIVSTIIDAGRDMSNCVCSSSIGWKVSAPNVSKFLSTIINPIIWDRKKRVIITSVVLRSYFKINH